MQILVIATNRSGQKSLPKHHDELHDYQFTTGSPIRQHRKSCPKGNSEHRNRDIRHPERLPYAIIACVREVRLGGPASADLETMFLKYQATGMWWVTLALESLRKSTPPPGSIRSHYIRPVPYNSDIYLVCGMYLLDSRLPDGINLPKYRSSDPALPSVFYPTKLN